MIVAERALDRDEGDELPDRLAFDRSASPVTPHERGATGAKVKEADEFARYAVAQYRAGHGHALAQRNTILATTLLLAETSTMPSPQRVRLSTPP